MNELLMRAIRLFLSSVLLFLAIYSIANNSAPLWMSFIWIFGAIGWSYGGN